MDVRGKYIVFEGPNGSGKSTLAHCLSMTLCDRGDAVASLAFPGRLSPIGAIIRDDFEGRVEVDPRAMLWLFVAEGVDLEARVLKALREGTTVLCDRHTQISAYVYQSLIHGFDHVHDVVTPAHFRAPDFVYFIDLPVEIAMERRRQRDDADEEDPFESDDRIAAERKAYLDLVEVVETWFPGPLFPDDPIGRSTQVRVLDGTRPIEDNVGLILDDLEA